MEPQEYQTLYQVEESYWWYIGLRELVVSWIDRFRVGNKPLKILDAGCGTGGMLKKLSGDHAFGLDFSNDAINFCRQNGLKDILQASVSDIPFPDHSFDLVLSLDVLCNTPPSEESKALREFSRVLVPDGLLILHLPGYNSLQGKHDRAVHIRHRYTCSELKDKLQGNGFTIEKLTYRNSFLFPFIAIKRLAEKPFLTEGKHYTSDLTPLPRVINGMMVKILSAENRLLRKHDFPFGLSVFCLARKK